MEINKILLFLFLTGSFVQNTFAQNIEISNSGNPNEPTIMIDPKNPNIIVAGSNLNYYYFSNDAGNTWSAHILTSPYGVWGDPSMDVDTSGNFYFFHLSNPPNGNWIDRIVCQKSTDNGSSWSGGTFIGLNGTKAQDKPWSVVDRNNNNIYLTWTQFDEYGSNNPLDSSIILFSKSLDGGNTWSSPMRINKVAGDCLDESNTVEGAVPAVGPNGEIYVSWAGPDGIVFNRSLDKGNTWLDHEILIDPMPNGWCFMIPGIMRANGQPVIKCDLSEGVNNGAIYVNWSDQRNGTDDTDIWLSKSIDGGNTWSVPSRVNDDGLNNHQFFSWMDIDQTSGELYFVFYDRRNYTDNQTDVYLAISTDGGNSFINKKISESPFVPKQGIFFGDYTNIVAHNDTIRPIWTRLHHAELSIWTDVTPISQILSRSHEVTDKKSNKVIQYPNPASNISYVSFKLHDLSNIKLEIYDQQGRKINTVINNDRMEYGKYIIPINLEELNLPSGIYYYKLMINDKLKTLKNIIVK